ncbi:hypothetical protein E3P99_02444 [Wallemia hederae]|uniref:A-kinase anchor protein 7-like phosphoesterase domain-containing protein n=1 Tax=Wallemia hederae TaxID=1540922 RepID=A0A4V4LT27_9BASI|nr:hypothetical protein E3P99_02444 [Wallemia hederae]
MKQRPTHFISIPLTKPALTQPRLDEIRSRLLQSQIAGIKEQDFIKASKLHFTIGLLLLTDKKLTAGTALLNSLKPAIIPLLQRRVELKLDRLGCFPKPDNARVLYCTPSEKGALGALEEVSRIVRRKFREEGLLTDTGPLNLHCTILKTSAASRRQKRPEFSFHAVQDALKDLSLGGPYPLERIEICEIGSATPDGFYKCEAAIAL